jgi:hypothetical protein|tara:strand:+ start:418 stop:714 length:297 start_codon:yes stop_codon:yes gene_type:complete
MAQTVKLKRSTIKGKTPTTSSLALGELAMNTYDGKIYFEKSGSSISVQNVVSTDSQTTGSIELTGAVTASYFSGDGSNITNLSEEDPNALVFSIVFGS